MPENELEPRSTLFGKALAELGGAVIDALEVMKDNSVRYNQYLTRPLVLRNRNNPPLVTICRYSTAAGMA